MRAESIDARLEQLGPPRRGQFAAGDQETRWTAWSLGGRPLKIEARMEQGEYGATGFEYYIDSATDSLAFVRERGVRVSLDADGTPRRDTIRIDGHVHADGNAMFTLRSGPGGALKTEVEALKRHYGAIRAALR